MPGKRVKRICAAIAAVSLLAGCVSEQAAKTREQSEAKSEAAGSETKPAAVSVEKSSYQFDTAGNMFAYAEFELSGEPLAEALGLDLDVLDIGKLDSPTPFDYAAGIESYEYSEEAMYEVVEKSGLGLHLVNGPINLKRAGGDDPRAALAKRYRELAEAVGYQPDEIFLNMFPTFVEYAAGDPHYITAVDTSKFADGEDGHYLPKYQVDFATLRWDRDKMEKTLTPAALGGTFLKQALWLGDFMGGLHTVDTDEELEASAVDQDQDPNIRLGVSAADGLQGVFLTEGVWNKLAFIRDQLFYSAKDGKLGATPGSKYDPALGLIYLPHAVQVEEDGNRDFPNAKSLKVIDKRSLLGDQWLMMWASAEFFGTTDQRPANPNKNPAFLALFDGRPFPSAPSENLDDDLGNDVTADDPFSLNRDLLLTLFANLEAMHWNQAEKTLVQEHSGEPNGQGSYVDTFDSGYAMEALRLFVRAVDGLPLGYASGEAAEGLKTQAGQRGLEMLRAQADFILDKLWDEQDGLVANGYTIGQGRDTEPKTLKAQLGAIRGLTAAFLATDDVEYREAARKLYDKMTQVFWDESVSAYRTVAGQDNHYEYDPYLAGAISAVHRIAMLNLVNTAGDQTQFATLELRKLTDTYTRYFRMVINGPTLEQGMQASEFWDTGDFYVENDNSGNTDQDTVPQIQAAHGTHGIAPILLPVVIKKN
ncbi:MAG: hypothetical protein H0Z34_09820 [Brevibacillus sp.]|nr:hypothetical protein [Brevibacillus sp.]